jgi:TRAP-type C4-dicarboxylate transport system permease small subunit
LGPAGAVAPAGSSRLTFDNRRAIMLKVLDRFLDGITAVVKTTMIVMTCAIFFITTITVFTRYLLDYVPSWSEEVPRYLLVWITYLGAALAVKFKEHISLDVFFKMMPLRARQVGHILLNGLIAVVGTIMVVYGVALVSQFKDDLMESIPVTNFWLYLVMPISGTLMLLFIIQDTWKAFLGLGKEEAPSSSEMVPI